MIRVEKIWTFEFFNKRGRLNKNTNHRKKRVSGHPIIKKVGGIMFTKYY